MKRLIPLIIAAAALAPMFFVHSCANTTEAPTGGIKDTIPPYITKIVPAPGVARVPLSGARFTFTFNEYVTVSTPSNILLSPPQQKPVKYRLRGKDLVIGFEEDLLPNTTYTLNFTDAVADANEGNAFPGYTYVFSSGDQVDSMLITGTVQDCNSLKPFKGATVLLYKDHSDSALFLRRPYAAAKTDDWGFFRLPYVADTLYRLYAIKDAGNNYIYDPDNDLVAFVDSLVRPVMKVDENAPEMLNYEMTDTLSCQARTSEYDLRLFREKPSKQFIKDDKRLDDRSAYISFQAPNAWIDSLWIGGYRSNQIITEFNILQDSLLIWVNSRRAVPDTLHLFVNYRKTDSLGVLKPATEHIRLFQEGKKRSTNSYQDRKKIQHTDTICKYTLKVTPEKVEQDGFELLFSHPIVSGQFDSLLFQSVNTRQRVSREAFTVEQDTLNLRRYVIRPSVKLQKGYEYKLKVPHKAFRDINGYFSDSTEVKVSLPTDDKLSTLTLNMYGVDRKVIVDLMDDRFSVVRSYVITSDTALSFPYLKAGGYSVRITDDANRNSIVDVGSVLEHRQPEKVAVYSQNGKKTIDIMEGADLVQYIDLSTIFK